VARAAAARHGQGLQLEARRGAVRAGARAEGLEMVWLQSTRSRAARDEQVQAALEPAQQTLTKVLLRVSLWCRCCPRRWRTSCSTCARRLRGWAVCVRVGVRYAQNPDAQAGCCNRYTRQNIRCTYNKYTFTARA
jgi:hypothetical protein